MQDAEFIRGSRPRTPVVFIIGIRSIRKQMKSAFRRRGKNLRKNTFFTVITPPLVVADDLRIVQRINLQLQICQPVPIGKLPCGIVFPAKSQRGVDVNQQNPFRTQFPCGEPGKKRTVATARKCDRKSSRPVQKLRQPELFRKRLQRCSAARHSA